jgi:tetratricopeptide (TPR) repeat protein
VAAAPPAPAAAPVEEKPAVAAAPAEKVPEPAPAQEAPVAAAPTDERVAVAAPAPAERAAAAPTPTDEETAVTPAERAKTMLADARQAYWLQDYAGAEKHYRALAALQPDNPEPHGELGNLYYSQGKWKEAGAAYYEAALRLLRAGNRTQAMRLYRVIMGLDPESAEKLGPEIEGSR